MYLGIDFGTSGARAIIIDEYRQVIFSVNTSFPAYPSVNLWENALLELLSQIPPDIAKKLRSIVLDATSSTVLLCDRTGNPLDDAIWYNDDRGKEYLSEIRAFAPENNLVISATSSLAKLHWWHHQPIFNQASYFLHQADWLAFLLHGKLGISDYHNALKLGYDVSNLQYPQWLQARSYFDILPQIKVPGENIATVSGNISKQYHINPDCIVKAGTTDSISAFLASGATQAGEAVTSLGSTLVLKLLSTTRVDDSRYGIYSHKLGDLWLTGGASNTGGAVLKHFFNPSQLVELSHKINPDIATNLNYYPLLTRGDRFPLNNPNLEPKMTPRPDNPIEFLQGLLEGITNIEAQAYQLLQELGASRLTKVYTAGGGANNEMWLYLRQKALKVDVLISPHTQSAYGSALLGIENVIAR